MFWNGFCFALLVVDVPKAQKSPLSLAIIAQSVNLNSDKLFFLKFFNIFNFGKLLLALNEAAYTVQ